jgi:serine/threonine-protein kinase CHEK2
LLHEDHLRFKGKSIQLIFKSAHEIKLYPRAVEKKYHIGRVIGNGMNGEVRLLQDVVTLEKFAIKTIGDFKESFHEISIMRKLNHPNVLNLVDSISMEKQFLITEYMNDGDLLQFLLDQPLSRMDESMTKFAVIQIVSGLIHIHDQNIAHLDLKPENILVGLKDGERIFKIGDFGHSVLTNTMEVHKGTIKYCAPELFGDRKSIQSVEACDMWSLGIIIYVCLSGRFPFTKCDGNVVEQILVGYLSYREEVWEKISLEASDVIEALVEVDPRNRITAHEILQAPWFNDYIVEERIENIKKIFAKEDIIDKENADQDNIKDRLRPRKTIPPTYKF